MLLIDTSVWILVFRDRSGKVKEVLAELIGTQALAHKQLCCLDSPKWSYSRDVEMSESG